MISRTTQSLLAAVGVLALAVGIAEVHPPTGQAAAPGVTVRTPVQHSSLVCPPPLQSLTGSTVYSLAVPGAQAGGAASGTAVLGALPGTGTATAPAPLAKQTAVGGASTAKAATGDKAAALLATADGSAAPGFTVQQTTTGPGNALSGTSCTAPATDFWFAGADSAKGSSDYVELTNAEATAADVDLQIFGPSGEIDSPAAHNISVPAAGTSSLLLSSLLSPGNDNVALTVHVLVRSGRVGAALHADTGSTGADWIPATVSGSSAVIPGLPGDISGGQLTVFVPDGIDADLKVQLASTNGWITPAGHETVHAKSGMVTVVDLGALTHGAPAAMRLTPSDPKQAVPFVAGVSVQRGKGKSARDVAYLPAASPIGQRATVAGNSATDTTLLLTATDGAAVVKVSEIGTDGTPTTQSVSVQAGATVAVTPKGPAGTYAVTVEPVSGGPVYAARMISRTVGSVPAFTIQQMPDDHSTVQIPRAVQNDSILMP